ncbi:MAG: histidine kinase [Pseudomonadota bacterium]
MAVSGGKQRVFKILRYFSITSLISILVAALLLTWLYRSVAINGIVSFGEHSNLMLSQSFLNAVQPELSVYLADETLHHSQPLPVHMEDLIRKLIVNTRVNRVNIIDDEGIIIFSTNQAIIGSRLQDSVEFAAANEGAVVSELNRQDDVRLLPFPESGVALINSYIPIRETQVKPIEGVFAVETDVRPLMTEIEQTEYQVFFASMGIMLLLYLVLLAIVRHAERIIRGQEAMLKERSHALKMLSAQLITVQEKEKKRVAEELHEGIAQTLSSIKFHLEHAHGLLREHRKINEPLLAQLVSLVQDAISEVRTLAMEMRPPSLDEIGVIATVQWHCNELSAAYPNLILEQEITVEEEDIPTPIKVVLYRTLQQILQPITHKDSTLRLKVSLGRKPHAIFLEVKDSHKETADVAVQEKQRADRATLGEFIALSGGEMDVVTENDWGGTTFQVEWPV